MIFDSGSVALAMRASMAFPGVFEPVYLGEKVLVDGGLANNLPVYIARQMNFDRVLAVDVLNFDPLVSGDLRTWTKVVYRTLEVAFPALGRSGSPADLTIMAGGSARIYAFTEAKTIMDAGEQAIRDNEKKIAAFFSP
jgi:NTE family protein